MVGFLPWTGASPLTYQIKTHNLLQRPWQFRWKPVCGNTEIELSKWLKSSSITSTNPRAVLAERQSHGTGQRGRKWMSPRGGVWLSAAIPYEASVTSTSLFGLAVVVALAQRFEEDAISVQIKWPNDLLVHHKKLVGVLPRIVFRGKTPYLMRLGIGLNVFNRTPTGGISLSEIYEKKNLSIVQCSLDVLLAIEKAISLCENSKNLKKEGERLLWSRKVLQPSTGLTWHVDGLDEHGCLKVRRGLKKETWNRWT